ncbi:hypothetical protein ACJJTC_003345 [Scirpophaga incertulas]
MDYLQYFYVFDELDRELPRKRKSYKKRFDPFTLNEEDFRKKYRFTKKFTRKIEKLKNLVRSDIEKKANGGGLSAEVQVCTALRTWARQEVQDDSADIHGLSQQSITNLCRRVAMSLAQKAPQFVFMPRNTAEQEEVMSGFRNICGFRNVIGAIDWAVHMMLEFLEKAGLDRFETGEFNGRLLGDSGYGLTDYLFTPVLNSRNEEEKIYNKFHTLTRNPIERCFGVWKQRFRCLLHGFSVSLENVKLYIVAIAVLHNIAIDMKEDIDFLEPVRCDDTEIIQRHTHTSDSRSGQAARRLFIETHF